MSMGTVAKPLDRVPDSGKLPLVLLHLTADLPQENVRPLLSLAADFGWRVISSTALRRTLPGDCHPIGILTNLPLDHPQNQWIRHLPCPKVRMGLVPNPLDTDYPAVLPDNEEAGALAARHFAERGFQHLGFVGFERWESTFACETFGGFKRQATQEGIACDLLLLSAGVEGESGDARDLRREHQLKEWIARLERPIGLFLCNARIATRFILLCEKAGIAIPEEISLIAYAHGVQCDLAPIQISGIDWGLCRIEQQAMHLLRSLIDTSPAPAEVRRLPPVGIIERQSTNTLAVPDLAVAKALRFIWDHLELQVPVRHIANQVGISLGILERRFKRHLGRSINAERHRKRLERCAELLLSTDLNVAEAGKAVGILNNGYLHRSFRKAFGMTPRQYRLRTAKPQSPVER